ncbi:FAD-dependent oxidoreductase [Hahella ganghwensis]|uniref:FAD-dependent oxidoreductase n=1 Tax=Hahella ganghwensis TaxID=286420 RepID=UPI00037E1628|nr:FAD-dependent monooxygenase [Hahella ganghwensis]
MNQTILIVGAGPTGLLMGCHLLRQGVDVRVIEKRATSISHSKALTINCASLKLLHDLGVSDSIQQTAQRVDDIYVHWQGRDFLHIDFRHVDEHFNYLAMQPQPVTEQAILKQFEALGGEVDREVELVDIIENNSDYVSVRLHHVKDQTEEICSFSYLVGCDGGKSRVRDELGFSFTGLNYDMYFILADLSVDWDGPRDKVHYFVEEDCFLILIPLTGDKHRIVIKVDGEYQEEGDTPPLELFQQYAARIGPAGMKLHDPIWISSAPFYNRITSDNVSGRCFLAGDASHLFSPIGGLGMNTGLQDAANLAWKLGLVMKGRMNPAVLESYRDERLFMAGQLLAHTDRSTQLISRLNPDVEALEPLWPKMSNRRFFRYGMAQQTGGTSQFYHLSDFVRDDRNQAIGQNIQPGQMAPFVKEITYGQKSVDSQEFYGRGALSILLFADTGDTKMLAELMDALPDISREYLRIFVITEKPVVSDVIVEAVDLIVDAGQKIKRAYDARDGDMFMIRPDLYIGYAGNMNFLNSIKIYFQRYFAPLQHSVETTERLVSENVE